MFSKINTRKADPRSDLESSIDAAIDAALKAKVAPAVIISMLEGRLPGLRRIGLNQDEARTYGNPQMFDPLTLRPIDLGAQVARAEEIREEKKRQAEIAAQRAADEKRLRDRAAGIIE